MDILYRIRAILIGVIVYRKAKIDDKEDIAKLLRRVSTSATYESILFPIPPISEEKIAPAIVNGEMFVAKDRRSILALGIVKMDVSSYFFPVTHDGGKLMNIMSKTDSRMSEDVLSLAYLAVDPLYQRRGIGSEMLSFLEARFARFLLVSSLDISNQKGIEFLRKNGFKKVDLEEFEFSPRKQQLLFKRL